MTVSSDTAAAIRRWAPKLDAKVVKRYGISAEALLTKLVVGESGDDANAVSSAGARGKTQFTAGSRSTAIKKYGVDPWRSTDEAIHAAVLHLNGKINGKTGLEGYNPGDPSYPKYILSRKVGDVGGHGAPTTVGSVHSNTTTTDLPTTETKTDDDDAIIDSVLAGPAGRRGASLSQDIADRISSGNYTNTETKRNPVTLTTSTPDLADKKTFGPGKVTFAKTADRAGVGTRGYVKTFLGRMTKWAGDLEVGTGTNHNRLTVNGNVSEHWTGSAADIPATGKRGDDIAYAAFRAAGISEKKARQWAQAGGLYNVNRNGKRYQIIWKTNEGGNHYDHVHVGIRNE